MYLALRIVALLFKLLSLVAVAITIASVRTFYNAMLAFFQGGRFQDADALALLSAVLFVFFSILGAVAIYAAGELIDLLISIERSVYTLRSGRALPVRSAGERRPPELPESREPSNAWRSPY